MLIDPGPEQQSYTLPRVTVAGLAGLDWERLFCLLAPSKENDGYSRRKKKRIMGKSGVCVVSDGMGEREEEVHVVAMVLLCGPNSIRFDSIRWRERWKKVSKGS